MASFAKLSVWPVGYFRAYSSWLLQARRELSARLSVLNAEIERIGFIKVYYRMVETPNGGRQVTEERVGVSVTENSNVERLLRAYIAQGGNPFDISPFQMPDYQEIVDISENGNPIVGDTYPHGGVVAPKSVNANSPAGETNGTGFGSYQGGFLETDHYYPARQGGRIDIRDLTIARTMNHIRAWSNQEIKERLQDIEWRIIKQMDLREQLMKERDEVLMQAFGGVSTALPIFDEDRFDPNLRVQVAVSDMYSLLYEMEGETVRSFSPNNSVGFMDFTFPDAVSEIRDSLGG